MMLARQLLTLWSLCFPSGTLTIDTAETTFEVIGTRIREIERKSAGEHTCVFRERKELFLKHVAFHGSWHQTEYPKLRMFYNLLT